MSTKDAAYSSIRTSLEALSLEIVLADPADPMAFKKSLGLLKKIHIQAKRQKNTALATATSEAAKCIQKIRKNQGDVTAELEALDTFIAEMPPLADPVHGKNPAHPGETEAPCRGNGPSSHPPSALPPHLSQEDVNSFLATKMPVLDKLEALILEFESGNTQETAHEMKRLIHTMKGECGFLSLTEAEHLCHRTEDLLLMDVAPDFAEILLQVKDWFQETFRNYALGRKPQTAPRQILSRLDTYAVQLNPASQRPGPDQDCEESRQGKIQEENNGFSRPVQIDARRLDQLIDIIGELAIAEAMVAMGVRRKEQETQAFSNALKALGQSTRALQEIGHSLRMVPLTPLFNRMKRMARDLARKQNKKLEVIIQGELTELDKNLVEGLADPLIHIIRNSIDHGIEPDALDRINAGKPGTAALTLNGFHKGGSLYIQVTDDGRGIDRDKLVQRAVAAGLVEETDTLDAISTLNLVFHSGLSTAEQVTDISGRGIGMDVARDAISQFNGTITLDSEPGKGTCVTLKLPLTLSIMDGMIVAVAHRDGGEEDHYVLPTLSIVSSMAVSKEMVNTAMGKNEYIRVREELIPLLDLNRFFNPGQKPMSRTADNGIVVIVEDAGIKAGLVVSELVSKQNFVRKPLKGISRDIPGVSGATILADGRVCLILDTAALVAAAREKSPQ
ncbi:MAG: chemotaxis protein CheA [Desulfobacter sp.]|nr:MAG: chemotaxis protein CheA [Desulfobacter sp.]